MNKLAAIAAMSFFVGCGGGGGNAISLTGSWVGDYTASSAPGKVYQGVMQLTQDGSSVTGTLTTNTGRSATVSGTLSGTRMNATFRYTDGCAGSSTTTSDVVQGPLRLAGNYSATDCTGSYTGGYILIHQ